MRLFNLNLILRCLHGTFFPKKNLSVILMPLAIKCRSIVFHDQENKTLMPIAEFLTTSHTINNISGYLYKIVNIYASVGMPRMIVTDFSWTMIIGCLKVFNSCEVHTYLDMF
jgi:hypothetical protein